MKGTEYFENFDLVKMHGEPKIKFVNAKQEKLISKNRNI
jgi:hypothetical protein